MIVGIDPGVKGYMCILYPNGQKKLQKIGDPLYLKVSKQATVYVEKVQPRPSQRLRGVVTSCVNYGILKAVLYFSGAKTYWITPQEWQKTLGLNRTWKRPKGLTDEQYVAWKYRERKKLHKLEATRLFPALKVTLENADAILIAEYGRKLLCNNSDTTY